MNSIFKAYDIRGIYPAELDEKTAYRIGRAFAELAEARTVVAGRDMRDSSKTLFPAAAEGITDAGADVVDIGMVTTPMVSFATATLGADAGIMVTASHNPARYNGFKLCGKGASPVSYDDGIRQIESRVREGTDARPVGPRKGRINARDVTDAYMAHLGRFAGKAKPMTIAVDAGNGIGGPFAARFLSGIPGVKTVGLYMEPDGSFPNHEANPLKPANLHDLQKAVRDRKCDLGVALDGDADRCVFVDASGAIVPTDLVTAVLARDKLSARKGPVVYDLRSSRAVPEEIRAAGGEPVRNRVGHSLMKKTMRERDAVFGGELSGHYYFRENFFCDSALVTLASMLSLLGKQPATLADLIKPLARYASTGEVNFEVHDPDAVIKKIAGTFSDGEIDYLDGITVQYPDWWFNVRKSNTEPVVRLNLEARTPAERDRRLAQVQPILGKPE